MWQRLQLEWRRWRRDTFSKRLFVLLWVTLVASHLLGFSLFRPDFGREGPGAHGPGATDGHRPPFAHGPPKPEVQRMVVPPFLPPHLGGGHPPPPERQAGPPPGGPNQWLEVLARVLVLGLGAWLGARWLTAPMRKLAEASKALSRAITQRGALPLMDARTGPAEVRQTAEVFNHMALHLQQQFEQRSLMMAAVSHDLRTPLTRLRMRLERLQPDPEVARCVADVQDINAMINAVLDAMNEERRQEAPALIDLWSLVQALADDLQEAGSPVTATGEAASVRVPPTGLKRVLDNLIGNALRYGHRADVSVRTTSAGKGEAPGSWVEVTIDDMGPGIPEDQLQAVFRPFYKLDASRGRLSGDEGGTGLGLYIARELVDRAGGHLSLSNRAEGGLRATLRYPAA